MVSAAAGYSHRLALCSDGTVAAWGINSNGQLGNNSTSQSNIPVSVTQSDVLAGKTVVSVAAGYCHSLALCSDGTLVAWGQNSSGHLGNGSTEDSWVPALVTQTGVLAGKSVVAVAAGQSHSLALCSDGTVAAWGDNSSGQLGNNSTTQSSVPVLVTQTGVLATKAVVSVAAGYTHSIAVCSDGTVAAWGDNSSGELGNNSKTQSNVPVMVTQSSGYLLYGQTVVSVVAGYNFNLALCSNGMVTAWGLNNYGQLGNGSTTLSKVPVLVRQTGTGAALSGKTVVSLSAAEYFSMAVCSDGTAVAWGYNAYGQLGNNLTANSNVPVMVKQNGILAGKAVNFTVAGGNSCFAVLNEQNPANLSSLSLSAGSLTPAFDPATTSYTASETTATASITVTPTAVDALATIRVNGTIVTSGTSSAAIPLSAGSNMINVKVTGRGRATFYL